MIIPSWRNRTLPICVAACSSAACLMLAGCAKPSPPGGPVTTVSSASSPGPAIAAASADTVSAGPRLMRGLYAFNANSGLFTDCASGQRLAVSPEADHMTLERAYGISRSFGESLLTSVEASVAMRPAAPVQPTANATPGSPRPMLVVQRFVGLSSDTSCPVLQTVVALETTYWKLEKLEGREIITLARSAEPHLTLQPATKRVSGSSGCNRLTGTYALEGNRLKFARPAAPGKPCRTGAAQERSLLATLARVVTWRITDRQLTLVDDKGTPVAQFSARAAR